MTSGTIHGVDFSGSQSPGRDIWITTAAADDDQLRISSVEPAAESLEGTGREEILDSLQSILRDADDAAIGLDFPFGFPQAPVDADDWTTFLANFTNRFDGKSIDAFPGTYATDGRSKRDVDYRYAGQSPMSPQVQYQVFYGLRDLLHPLVHDNEICVRPMMDGADDLTDVLEVYPAATFGRLNCYRTGYEGSQDAERRREATATALLELDGVSADDVALEDVARESDDALDSAAAAVAVWHAVSDGLDRDVKHDVEGYIYA